MECGTFSRGYRIIYKVENNFMALFDQYNTRAKELAEKMQTLKEFEKTDESVKNVVDIAREILKNPKNMLNTAWLLTSGGKLAAYYGYLTTKGNECWAEYKAAEIAFKEVRDALLIAIKNDKATITEAKASASRDTGTLEVDVILKEKRSRDYEAAAKWCQAMLSFVQSTLRQIENERAQAKMQGQRPQ